MTRTRPVLKKYQFDVDYSCPIQQCDGKLGWNRDDHKKMECHTCGFSQDNLVAQPTKYFKKYYLDIIYYSLVKNIDS